MPSQKKKLKKNKMEDTVTLPVQIKTEPVETKPLSAYIEDRVELIRQAFMCLKPKEIQCLVPDFLQGKSIEYIQEQCLDEVLGISTKRLHSIINCTRCPTDTESSSDEDVQGMNEHISLDEISSDSDVDTKQLLNAKNSNSMGTKKKRRKNMESNTDDKIEKNGNKKHEKEMTVLELLELQARARAIRSQLALEPVTKIELDSDQEAGNGSDTNDIRPSKSSEMKENSNAADCYNSENSRQSPAKKQPKRILLKRNFRIRQVGDDDGTEETAQKPIHTASEDVTKRSRSKSEEKADEPQHDPVVNREGSQERDSSPEVIPVIPSPETLCISSDSEEEKLQRKKSDIFVDNIAELDRLSAQPELPDQANQGPESEEPEEGEISDEEKSIKDCSVDEQKESATADTISVAIVEHEHDEELDYEVKEISDSDKEKSDHSKDQTQIESEKNDDRDRTISTSDSSNSSDSEAESVSSVNDRDVDKTKSSHEEEECLDIVEIHDSSDETLLDQTMAEDDREKSWNSRWLESNRVAKVMATSRLGNKVRDKLKKDKKKKQEKEQEIKVEEPSTAPVVESPPTISTAEVGSVEHYNELIAKSVEQQTGTGEENVQEKELNELTNNHKLDLRPAEVTSLRMLFR
ncbi:clumping factor A isoform X2 [Toxorhynchites rutilus septentrionalis]|uniref:clumping factor A isoform X2 n=1 Tax=Toxorhynchites rutilus septentrionalis TaxID=329112 RepID=UPI0024788551|nr:clumping factor A isoform X2 [Toxorhynchites rutilus septentrionalis]